MTGTLYHLVTDSSSPPHDPRPERKLYGPYRSCQKMRHQNPVAKPLTNNPHTSATGGGLTVESARVMGLPPSFVFLRFNIPSPTHTSSARHVHGCAGPDAVRYGQVLLPLTIILLGAQVYPSSCPYADKLRSWTESLPRGFSRRAHQAYAHPSFRPRMGMAYDLSRLADVDKVSYPDTLRLFPTGPCELDGNAIWESHNRSFMALNQTRAAVTSVVLRIKAETSGNPCEVRPYTEIQGLEEASRSTTIATSMSGVKKPICMSITSSIFKTQAYYSRSSAFSRCSSAYL